MSGTNDGGSSGKFGAFLAGAFVIALIIGAVVAYNYYVAGWRPGSAPTVAYAPPQSLTRTPEEIEADVASGKFEMDSLAQRSVTKQTEMYGKFGASPPGGASAPVSAVPPIVLQVAGAPSVTAPPAVVGSPPPAGSVPKRTPPEPGITVKMPEGSAECYYQVQFKKTDEEKLSATQREDLVKRVFAKFCSETGTLVQTSGTITVSDGDTQEIPWQARAF